MVVLVSPVCCYAGQLRDKGSNEPGLRSIDLAAVGGGQFTQDGLTGLRRVVKKQSVADAVLLLLIQKLKMTNSSALHEFVYRLLDLLGDLLSVRGAEDSVQIVVFQIRQEIAPVLLLLVAFLRNEEQVRFGIEGGSHRCGCLGTRNDVIEFACIAERFARVGTQAARSNFDAFAFGEPAFLLTRQSVFGLVGGGTVLLQVGQRGAECKLVFLNDDG